jgi:hypothetical protein
MPARGKPPSPAAAERAERRRRAGAKPEAAARRRPSKREAALAEDFVAFAAACLTIATKRGALDKLRLNAAQRHIHAALEEQRAETGRVRALVLKGRQQGASTYVEARFFWLVTRSPGRRAFILAHVEDASRRLFEIAKRFQRHCPEPFRQHVRASNARELVFDALESGYRVATAGGQEPGRSDTVHYFHGSEVAFWPHAERHVAGALQAVPDEAGSEVILESTSAGRRGLFHAMCAAALRGEGDYRLVFVPWFWQEEYRRRPAADFALGGEEAAYAEAHGLAPEQMAWRRAKLAELGGAAGFRREYPATPEEAFAAETEGALWRRELLDAQRVGAAPALSRVVIAVDPSGGAGSGHDEAGIVAAGIAADGALYLLEDLSGRLRPDQWGARAVAAYRRHAADRIVAERNFGGDMVAEVIRAVDPAAPVKLVTASRGKLARAEPVAALYERGRVHHVGRFAALEDELVTWNPLASARSPNRLDALVWALSELALGPRETGLLDFYAAEAERLGEGQAEE